MIGRLVAKWPLLGDAIKAVGALVVYVGDSVLALGNLLANIFISPGEALLDFMAKSEAAVSKLINAFPGLRNVVDSVKKAFVTAGDAVTATWRAVIDLVKGAVDWAVDKTKSILSTVASVGGLFGQPLVVQQGMAAGQAALGAASASPLASMTSAGISNSRSVMRNNTVTIDRIEVNTQATDAQGIGDSIGEALRGPMSQVVNYYDDGVAG
jgi:hypothetical protein